MKMRTWDTVSEIGKRLENIEIYINSVHKIVQFTEYVHRDNYDQNYARDSYLGALNTIKREVKNLNKVISDMMENPEKAKAEEDSEESTRDRTTRMSSGAEKII